MERDERTTVRARLRENASFAWEGLRSMPRLVVWAIGGVLSFGAAVSLLTLVLWAWMSTGGSAADWGAHEEASMPTALRMEQAVVAGGPEEAGAWSDMAADDSPSEVPARDSLAEGRFEDEEDEAWFGDGIVEATPGELGSMGFRGAGAGGGGAAARGRVGLAERSRLEPAPEPAPEPEVAAVRRPSSPAPARPAAAPSPSPSQSPVVEAPSRARRAQARPSSSTREEVALAELEVSDEAEVPDLRQRADGPSEATLDDVVFHSDATVGRGSGRGEVSRAPDRTPSGSVLDGAAQAFLDERERVAGVAFQAATGYWYNTYVPGDPRLRQLAQAVTSAAAGRAVREAFERPASPYDAPESGALALSVHGDRVGIEGETRMLVEVGLRASDRQGGYRGPMQVVVVLDVGSGNEGVVEALLGGLAEAWDVGDRFGVVVAGRPGGVIAEPTEFGWGRAQVAAQRFARPDAAAETLDAERAWQRARELLEQGDPEAGLGGTMIWWVTSSSERALSGRHAASLHAAAVEGITTSAFGVGAGVSTERLEAIAVAGQGMRRHLATAEDAPRAVRDEITAASQVVARAVRLRIRLAPGVRLVGIPGSYSLDAAAAERVRQAEQGVDRRVAAALGIASDRGEDEDGVQIVIPAFLAGDSHTILLDVVATRPGVIADVQVRFKDLVELRNGVLHDSYGVRGIATPRGPREVAAWRALVTARVGSTLEQAAELARSGRPAQAAEQLRAGARTLRALAGEVVGWSADPTLRRQAEALDWLAGRLGESPNAPGLVDGMELAAHMQRGPVPGELRASAAGD